MKSKQHNILKLLTLCLGPAIAGMTLETAQAVPYYWDENDSAAGFGTAGTVATNWGPTTSLLSTNALGTTSPTGTQTNGTLDTVNFGTATDGLGSGTITVSNSTTASNMTFAATSGAITITGGTLNLGTSVGITLLSNNTGNVIGTTLIGNSTAQVLTIQGSAATTLTTITGANTFNRAVTINTGKLSISSIGSIGGASSNLGAPTTSANGTINVIGGGTLLYTSTGETSDRVINLSSGNSSGGIVDQSGSGLLKFTGGLTSTASTGTKTLTLQGSTAGTGELSGIIANGTQPTAITKSGTGTWTLSNANTYSGKTTITGGAGTLIVSSIGSVNGGASNLGAVTTVANGTIDMAGGGRLLYSGTGETTDRVINLVSGAGSGAIIDQSGTGLLKLTSGVTSTGTSSKTLTLQGSTAGTGEISGVIADNGGTNITILLKSGSGTWTLSSANTYSGKTTISGGALSVSTIGSIGGGASNLGAVTSAANGTIDMTGGGRLLYTGTGETSDRVINLASNFGSSAVLDQSGTGILTFTGGVTSTGTSSKTLTLQGSTAGTGEISGIIADNGGTNITSVIKSGSGTWTIPGASTYTGNTTVTGGTLVVSNNSATTFADSSTISIAATAVLNLPVAATDTVSSLVIAGSPLAAGLYDSSSLATSGYITGPGKLQVTGVASYSIWASTNAGGQTAELDFDSDGVKNGVEFFMNAPAGFTANPAVVVSAGPVRTVTWINGGNIPTSAYGTQYVVQTSPDLLIWTDVPSGSLTTNTNGPAGSLTYTLTGTGTSFVRLKVVPN